jgi:hypothetical protein
VVGVESEKAPTPPSRLRGRKKRGEWGVGAKRETARESEKERKRAEWERGGKEGEGGEKRRRERGRAREKERECVRERE